MRGYAAVNQRESRKKERIKNLGDRCLEMVQDIDISSSNLRIDDNEDLFVGLWSKYLPIALEVEKMGLVTPDCGIKLKDDMSIVGTYLQFVGNLLKNQQVKTPKNTARSLTEEPSHQDENSLPQSRLSTAIGRLRRILPG